MPQPSRHSSTFQILLSSLRESRDQEIPQKALMPFQVIGDPNPELSHEISLTLADNGAEILEFGFPFSDPVADGPIIQRANARARKNQMRTKDSFDFLSRVKAKTNLPISLLVYHNLIFRYGYENFIQDANQSGVDSILVIDLPYLEKVPSASATKARTIGDRGEIKVNEMEDTDFFELLDTYTAKKSSSVQPVFIATEMTSDQRLRQLTQQASNSYLYLTSRLGVTGIQQNEEQSAKKTKIDAKIDAKINANDSPIPDMIRRIRQISLIPIFVGFGIATPEDVSKMIHFGADGVIVGSALIHRIEKYQQEPKRMLHEIAMFLNLLRERLSPTKG